MNKKIYLFLVIFSFLCHETKSQERLRLYEHKLSKALGYQDNRNYRKALEILLVLDTVSEKTLTEEGKAELDKVQNAKYAVKFNIAICMSKVSHSPQKALPYIEAIIDANLNDDILQQDFSPADIGLLYLQNHDFDRAIYFFNKELNKNNKKYVSKEIRRMIEMAENAKKMMSKAEKEYYIVTKAGKQINTRKYSEENPFINYSGTKIFFEQILLSDVDSTLKKEIYTADFQFQVFPNKKKIIFPEFVQKNIKKTKIAGIGQDGKKIYLSIEINNNSDIYEADINGTICENVKKLRGDVNTEKTESKVWVSRDGNTMLFSSNRKEAFGGRDIFRAKKQADGSWRKVKVLGPEINTAYDEDSPFFDEKEQKLYFSSAGHSSIGFNDIFVAKLKADNWETPKNMEYPISTVYDNMSFSVSPEKNFAFFSAPQFDDSKRKNIYFVNLEKQVEKTLLKGKITEGNNKKNMRNIIAIYDIKTGKKVPHVYDSRFYRGNYVAILKPSHTYDMFIKDTKDKYINQIVRFHVPRQMKFHEITQFVHFISLKPTEKIIGQQIRVRNAFFDVMQYSQDTTNREGYYRYILTLLDSLIANTNKEELKFLSRQSEYKKEKKENLKKRYKNLLSFVEDAIKKTDSVSLRILQKKAYKSNIYEQNYFFQEKTPKELMTEQHIGNQTVKALPKMYATNSYSKDDIRYSIEKNIYKTKTNKNKLQASNMFPKNKEEQKITLEKIHFTKNNTKINSRNIAKLEKLTDFLLQLKNYELEIVGYSGTDGTEYSQNSEMSEIRCNEVIQQLISNGIQSNRIKKIPKSEIINSSNEDKRVDIILKNYR